MKEARDALGNGTLSRLFSRKINFFLFYLSSFTELLGMIFGHAVKTITSHNNPCTIRLFNQ